jgi:hypothetical protein
MTEIWRPVLAIAISVLILSIWISPFLLRNPPRRSLVHFNLSWYSSCYLRKKRKIGEDVGVWYIPMRHVKLELWGDFAFLKAESFNSNKTSLQPINNYKDMSEPPFPRQWHQMTPFVHAITWNMNNSASSISSKNPFKKKNSSLDWRGPVLGGSLCDILVLDVRSVELYQDVH